MYLNAPAIAGVITHSSSPSIWRLAVRFTERHKHAVLSPSSRAVKSRFDPQAPFALRRRRSKP
jgi:hypothetical protein